MNVISISNKTAAALRVMLEPTADTFDINPFDTAKVQADFALSDQLVEIEYHPENFVSIWVMGDVIVTIGDEQMTFPDL